jgi:hypothetical protein
MPLEKLGCGAPGIHHAVAQKRNRQGMRGISAFDGKYFSIQSSTCMKFKAT